MKILVFQQNHKGETKIAGIRKYGGDEFSMEIVSIEDDLPAVLDDARDLLPQTIEADLVLDFMQHPDLSYDLAQICSEKEIPLVASGKKHHPKHVITPPT
jgi:thymidylate synthase